MQHYVIVGSIILLIILMLYFVMWYNKEDFTAYLDQMAMQHPDPTYFYYFGNRRDLDGMSGRDYYLNNLIHRDDSGLGEPQNMFSSNIYRAPAVSKYYEKN